MEIKDVEPRAMYVMFDLIMSHDGIFYWENVVSYPKELVDLIESVDKKVDSYSSIPKWSNWSASDDESTRYGDIKFIDTSKRKASSSDDMLNKNILYIVNSLMMAPEMCAIDYSKRMRIDQNNINLNLDYIALSRYDEGKGMGPHCDAEDPNGTGTNLKYSLVTYLNDDYEGGEIYFKNQDLKIKPKAGSLVLFPSTNPYVHESLPVKNGKKYMYTTHWLK